MAVLNANATLLAIVVFIILLAVLAFAISTLRQRNDGDTPSIPSTNALASPEVTTLEFGPSEKHCAIEFCKLDEINLPPIKRSIDPSSTGLSRLGPCLQAVVSILPRLSLASGNYMKVVVNGTLELESGTDSFFPFVRYSNGKISELARLFEADRVTQIASAAAVWNVASLIVAQKHLADINQKLEEIQRGIREIREFLETERVTRITGKLSQLREFHQAIMRGDLLSGSVRSELERSDGELIQILQHLEADLDNAVERIATIKHADFVGTKRFADDIDIRLQNLHVLQQRYLLCASARAVTWQVWSVFPGETNRKTIRKKEILTAIDHLTKVVARAKGEMHNKIGKVESRFTSLRFWERTPNRERQDKLTRKNTELSESVAFSAHRLQDQIRRLEDPFSGRTSVVLALKVEGNTVVEAYEIDAPSTAS